MQPTVTSITLALKANEEYSFSSTVNFIYCRSGSSTFSLSADTANPVTFEAGVGIESETDINNIRLTNGAIAQTIVLVFGKGKYVDNRLVGNLALSGGLRTQAATSSNMNLNATPTTTASQIYAANSGRGRLIIQNIGANDVYVGASGVTVGTGWKIPVNNAFSFSAGSALFAITASGTTDLRMIEEVA